MTARSLATAAALSLAMSAASAAAQSPERAVDALLAPYAAPGAPGAAVVVIRDGHVALAKGYGLADVDARTPVGPTTNFRLASLSKQFTATLTMLLVADGKLGYDDEIATRLPGLPTLARGVTVRHLLNHTSGLPDYEDFVPDSQTRQVLDADVPALIAHADSAYFAPGTRYRYSNTGYVLLALLAERATGKRFAELLRERIFAPLGMTATLARENAGPPVPHRAYGHTIDSTGRVRRTDQSNTSATLGDGGIYSSVVDLARWDSAIERHAIVSADAQRLAWTPPTLRGGEASPYGFGSYGFGWFVDRDRGTLRVAHHGESRGFTNAVVRFPDRRLAVWVLTNRTGGEPWTIAGKVAELYLEKH